MIEKRHDPIAENEELVARLFERVSRRVRVPDDQEQVVRESLRQEWTQVTRARKNRRWVMLASAASVLVVISLMVNLFLTPAGDGSASYLANIERRTGEILVYDSGENRWENMPAAQSNLSVGHTLATKDDSRLAIHWRDGGMLRIDENTEFRIASNNTLELIAGQVYYDSQYQLGANQPYVNLLIETPLGLVRHIGTRFMTAVEDGSLIVSVRDGDVLISGDPVDPNRVELMVQPGQQKTISDDGNISTVVIDASSPEFGWLSDIALSYQLDGKTASEFLEWVSGESGYDVQYESDEARQTANRSELSPGTIGLKPLRALEVVMQTTSLKVNIVDQTILVGVR